MLWKDRNGKMQSTTNLLPQTSTDQFIENCEEVAKITGNLNLFEEMFGPDPYNERGQDSAFMDDNFGGWLMFASLTKTRSKKQLRQIHMKFLMLCGVGVLLWTNTSARTIISDGLYSAAEIVRPANWIMKMYRVCVETNDGCCTIWYEQSRAKDACNLINERVYNQLCGLNIKEVSVTPSVWIMQFLVKDICFDFTTDDDSLDYIKTEQQGYEYILEVTGEHPLGIWEADDEDDLVEEITCATGYCISAINFEQVLTDYNM